MSLVWSALAHPAEAFDLGLRHRPSAKEARRQAELDRQKEENQAAEASPQSETDTETGKEKAEGEAESKAAMPQSSVPQPEVLPEPEPEPAIAEPAQPIHPPRPEEADIEPPAQLSRPPQARQMAVPVEAAPAAVAKPQKAASTKQDTEPTKAPVEEAKSQNQQSEAEKSAALREKEAKIIKRKDFSGRFSFVLPEGWRTYQIPYQQHDVLSLRENDAVKATISFSDELGNNLESLKDSTVENNKKALEKYDLAEARVGVLPNGQPCARLIGMAKSEDIDSRLVQYIVSLKKKHFLVVTLNASKPEGEKYDKLLREVVSSISTDPMPQKATK